MIFTDILFELKRIANALEVLADTKLEQIPKGEAPVPELFDTRITSKDEEKEADAYVDRINKRLEEEDSKGYFFAEDGLSEELLERL